MAVDILSKLSVVTDFISPVIIAVLAIGFFFLILVGIFGYRQWFYSRFNIDVDLFKERMNGMPVRGKCLARIYKEDSVRKIQYVTMFSTLMVKLAPDNDTLMPLESGRLAVGAWIDKHGRWHQVKVTKNVPIEVEFDESGNVSKVLTELVVFAPVKENDVEMGKIELRRLWNRHKDKSLWERYGPLILLILAFCFAAFIFLISLYFSNENLKATASSAASAAAQCAEQFKIVQAVAG